MASMVRIVEWVREGSKKWRNGGGEAADRVAVVLDLLSDMYIRPFSLYLHKKRSKAKLSQ